MHSRQYPLDKYTLEAIAEHTFENARWIGISQKMLLHNVGEYSLDEYTLEAAAEHTFEKSLWISISQKMLLHIRRGILSG